MIWYHGHPAGPHHPGQGGGAGGQGVSGGGVVSAPQHHEGAGEPEQDASSTDNWETE